MAEPLNINPPKRIQIAAIVTLSCLSLFLLVKTFGALNDIDNTVAQNTITVSGKGETFAVPDIATFTFSVTETGTTVSEAQTKATDKNNAALKYLKNAGVADKDIKTESYSANPQYDYNQIVCVKYPCPPTKPTLNGYEVSQTISVKVRDTKKAGDILSNIGEYGVTNISGLTFTIDNDDVLKADARALAISDAKAKAEELAKDLGVGLGKVTSFSEESNGYPYPVYAMEAKATGMGGAPAVAPDVPTGENKITVNVTVTYKIK
jgi:uncharacterized protein YggE